MSGRDCLAHASFAVCLPAKRALIGYTTQGRPRGALKSPTFRGEKRCSECLEFCYVKQIRRDAPSRLPLSPAWVVTACIRGNTPGEPCSDSGAYRGPNNFPVTNRTGKKMHHDDENNPTKSAGRRAYDRFFQHRVSSVLPQLCGAPRPALSLAWLALSQKAFIFVILIDRWHHF